MSSIYFINDQNVELFEATHCAAPICNSYPRFVTSPLICNPCPDLKCDLLQFVISAPI